uniref:Neur_chan_LBD domain-containing protein n=1 Tax=Parastrongyloides trichosuri TaxID=131310 RepID=A0A0N4ZXG7_PARTI
MKFLITFILFLVTKSNSTFFDNHLTVSTFSSEEFEKDTHLPYLYKLYGDLFKNYHSEIRPILNDSKPTEVTIQFWLKQVLKVNERDQTIRLYLWLELYWIDEILTWNPLSYGNITEIHVPSSKIWKPDLVVYNRKD